DTRAITPEKPNLLLYSSALSKKLLGGAVKRLEFSSLIPNWVASVTETGSLDVWDLRMCSNPAFHIETLQGTPLALSLSSLQGELVATRFASGTVKLWSLRHEPLYCVGTWNHSNSAYPIHAARFTTHSWNEKLLALSTDGTLSCIALGTAFMDRLCDSGY